MDWKKETEQKLRMYAVRKQSLISIPGEIQELKEASRSIRSATSDSSPVSGGGSRLEDVRLNNIVKREELAIAYRQAARWVKRMDAALEILTEEERMILDRCYIYPEKGCMDRIALELGVDIKTAYRRKDAALFRLTNALYGAAES